MEFNISKHHKAGYLYKDLKEWFLSNLDELPEMINGQRIVQYNVKETCLMWLDTIQTLIDERKNPKKSDLALNAKNKLAILYEELQDPNNWNREVPHLGTIKY